MNDSWTTLFDHGWIISTLQPLESPVNPPLILLHGLSGDENSLKQLAQNLKRNRWILSLRGILAAPDEGYAWAPAKTRDGKGFNASVEALYQEWPNIQALLGISTDQVDLFGFSQGAAFAAMLLITHPEWVRDVAIVSGFVPEMETSFNLLPLSGHRVFISHGTEDDVVPFAEAARSIEFLSSCGAEVESCNSNTRHKIGAYCLQQLSAFFG